MVTEDAHTLQALIDRALLSFDDPPEHNIALAKRIANENPRPLAQAWTQCIRGMALANTDYEQAKDLLEASVDYAKANGDRLLFAATSCFLGYLQYRLGNVKALGLHSQEAVTICEQLDRPLLLAKSYNNLGTYYHALNMYENAMQFLEQALALYEIHRPDLVYKIRGGLGILYAEVQHYAKAEHAFREAATNAHSNGDLNNEILQLTNIVHLLTMQGKYQEAIEVGEHSISRMRDLGESRHFTRVYGNLGMAFTLAEAYETGHDYYVKGLDNLNLFPNPTNECTLLLDIGINYLRQDWLELAFTNCFKSLEIAEQLENQQGQYKAHEQLAIILEKQGQFEKALTHFKKFYTLKEKVHEGKTKERIDNLIIAHEVQQIQRERDLIQEKNQELEKVNNQLEDANKELERMTVTDALTKVYNRRYLETQLANEFEQARRDQLKLSTILCDIDHFKQINDNFSHAIGDEVLRLFAQVVKTNVRDYDIVARYGGEEFAVVLPNTEKAAAVSVAEKIRQAVERFSWSQVDPKLKVTLSLGVASGIDFESYEKLLDAADQKLYDAKHGGRNQVAA